MKNIWKLFVGDVRRLTSNIVSIIIVTGLVVIPGLFSWFNISASWDPFANTGNLKFAVANDDEGAEAETTATLHDLGNTVQTNDLFNVAGILLRLLLLFHINPALVVLADH